MLPLTTPLNWQRVRLGDIAEIKRGASPRPIENPKWFCANSNVGWVRISDISKNSRFLYKTAQKLSKKGIEKSRLVKQNSLIMSMCATIGKPIITKIDTCIHDGFVVFENPKIDLNYLYYFLCYIEKEWLESGQQGSQVNLNADLIKNKEVFYPKDLNEQNAIANILSGLDRYLCALDALILKKEGVKKALRIKMLKQILASNGVEFRKLGEVCDFQNGFAFQRKNFRNTGLPIIRISNIQNDRLLLDEVIYFSLNDYKGTNFEPFKITKGDILIAMSGATTGKIGILTFDTTLYLNQRVGKFKPNIMKLNNKFLYYFLLTKINFLYSLAGGGAQPNLSSNQILQQITIPLPSLNEQSAIANILSALDNEITSLKNKKRQFENIKKALNHDLMSAKIRVLEK
ncbi:restriction endonuclease subunit S [Helicobacter pylori]|uniref:restriction endonuclease subunit S n=1 Tax=Helicobacter pylori TaxID=210 RepID=UPI001FD39D36|nr:restriction endonuclease subunit S [Helicobacter pylori]UOS68976.1 restriction endonuclease subunit S [Helicobacter pylori]